MVRAFSFEHNLICNPGVKKTLLRHPLEFRAVPQCYTSPACDCPIFRTLTEFRHDVLRVLTGTAVQEMRSGSIYHPDKTKTARPPPRQEIARPSDRSCPAKDRPPPVPTTSSMASMRRRKGIRARRPDPPLRSQQPLRPHHCQRCRRSHRPPRSRSPSRRAATLRPEPVQHDRQKRR